MADKSTKTSWGNVAAWYDDVLSRDGSFQQDLILPNLLRLADIKKGDTVLDVACGQGFFSREFYKKGAKVFGIDISPELIAIAKQKSKDVVYYVSSADNFKNITDKSIDKIMVVLAIQNIENVKKMLQECDRVAKNNSSLFIIMNHPAFRIPQWSSWGWDALKSNGANKGLQYRRTDCYLSEKKIRIKMHPGSEPGAETISFHRPLQYYSKLLSSAGFCIVRIEEWESKKKSQSGPRAAAEDIARKEFPMFLCVEAKLHGRL